MESPAYLYSMISQITKFPVLIFSACLIFMHCNAQLDQPQNDSLEPELDLLMTVHTTKIYQDSEDVIWIGTINDGLGRYENETFTFYEQKDDLLGRSVKDIAEDSIGNLWLATDGGVSVFNKTAFTNYTTENQLISNDVNCITIDSKQVIWVGTAMGVSKFVDGKFLNFQIPDLASNSDAENPKAVHSITEDSEGNIWFGSNTGAWMYDSEALEKGLTPFNHYSIKDGLCDDKVLDILEDSRGDFWFATHNGGVCVKKNNQFIQMANKSSLAMEDNSKKKKLESTGWSLYEDESGTIYFPVNGQCTYHSDGITASDLFPKSCYSHTMMCALESTDGTLWLGGWSGIFRVDR